MLVVTATACDHDNLCYLSIVSIKGFYFIYFLLNIFHWFQAIDEKDFIISV